MDLRSFFEYLVWVSFSVSLWVLAISILRQLVRRHDSTKSTERTQDSSQIQGLCMECGESLIVLELYNGRKLDRTAICCPGCHLMAINIAEFQNSSG